MKIFKKDELKVYKKLWWFMLLIIAVLITVSCSKDDEGTSFFVTTSNSNFTITSINNCSTSSGPGTILRVHTPYQLSDSQTIEKLLIRTMVSNGETEENSVTTFQDDGSKTTFANCFRFGSQAWVEFQIRLESSEGVISNTSTIRIDKPNGAE